MINDSARILKEEEIKGEKLDFRYIIVDEYQDISRQRFNLTRELSSLCDAKVIAVGDDWQSIYAYAGSDISLFTKTPTAGMVLSIMPRSLSAIFAFTFLCDRSKSITIPK